VPAPSEGVASELRTRKPAPSDSLDWSEPTSRVRASEIGPSPPPRHRHGNERASEGVTRRAWVRAEPKTDERAQRGSEPNESGVLASETRGLGSESATTSRQTASERNSSGVLGFEPRSFGKPRERKRGDSSGVTSERSERPSRASRVRTHKSHHHPRRTLGTVHFSGLRRCEARSGPETGGTEKLTLDEREVELLGDTVRA
jgi:hypothetical protein